MRHLLGKGPMHESLPEVIRPGMCPKGFCIQSSDAAQATPGPINELSTQKLAATLHGILYLYIVWIVTCTIIGSYIGLARGSLLEFWNCLLHLTQAAYSRHASHLCWQRCRRLTAAVVSAVFFSSLKSIW